MKEWDRQTKALMLMACASALLLMISRGCELSKERKEREVTTLLTITNNPHLETAEGTRPRAVRIDTGANGSPNERITIIPLDDDARVLSGSQTGEIFRLHGNFKVMHEKL